MSQSVIKTSAATAIKNSLVDEPTKDNQSFSEKLYPSDLTEESAMEQDSTLSLFMLLVASYYAACCFILWYQLS